jgi:hypothetical protein
MKFFPLPKAGIVHDHFHHYWLEVPTDEEEGRKIDTSFLWQGPHFPFAYPYASYHPNSRGRLRTQLSYPPDITDHLLVLNRDINEEATWRTISAQRF